MQTADWFADHTLDWTSRQGNSVADLVSQANILKYGALTADVRIHHITIQAKRLNYIITPFAPAYLPEFRRTFVLRAVEEVVGVLKTTGEGKVSLVALISIMTHIFFVERQHFRHLQMRLYHQGAQTEMYSSSPSLNRLLRKKKQKGKINNEICWHDLALSACPEDTCLSP